MSLATPLNDGTGRGVDRFDTAPKASSILAIGGPVPPRGPGGDNAEVALVGKRELGQCPPGGFELGGPPGIECEHHAQQHRARARAGGACPPLGILASIISATPESSRAAS